MGLRRDCSKTGCARPAVATLTYAYADRAVVLGPLATYAEPHTYDLCLGHAERMTAPRGWEVVRVGGEFSEPARESDDLSALADAVREGRRPRGDRPSGPAGRPPAPHQDERRARLPPGAVAESAAEAASGAVESGRRGHLRILRDT